MNAFNTKRKINFWKQIVRLCACGWLAGNGQGLAMAGDLKFVRPQPKLLEKLKLKITTKSQIEKRQAGTEADSEQMPKITTSSPAIAKPNVTCWHIFRVSILLLFSSSVLLLSNHTNYLSIQRFVCQELSCPLVFSPNAFY